MVKQSGYAPVNGLQLYYEMEGIGDPLLHLGMGFAVAGVSDRLTAMLDRRQVISVDMQGRGRTADIGRPLTFQQQAEDTIGLLDYLGIGKVDLFGECVGGIVAMLMAIRHSDRVRRVATYGTALGRFDNAYRPEVLAGTMELTPDSPVFEFQRTNYQQVAPDPTHWPAIWKKFGETPWNGFSRAELASVSVPALIAVGDQDWVRIDQAVDYFNTIPGAELAIIPDAGHFVLDAEPDKLISILDQFLCRANDKLPFATAAVPYLPGVSR